MSNSGAYPANGRNLVEDPRFAGIPMSRDAGDRKGADLTVKDFITATNQVIDTGKAPGGRSRTRHRRRRAAAGRSLGPRAA
jgi:hypothetical protein